jgi:phosphoribosyl 1,2-cyclic phosphodiesterase
MKVATLQSGSNGNCIYVEAQDVRLLFDAGIPGSVVRDRLAALGQDVHAVDALILSHEHADHVRCAGVYRRMFRLPIHATKQTYAAANHRFDLGAADEVEVFRAGDTIRFDGVAVETLRTAHDAVDGVAFVVDDGQRRLGILTDLGHVFQGLAQVVSSLDAVIIESNYDPDMLRRGPYPQFLKQRICGPGGHVSNDEAAELLAEAGKQLKWACLAHLSERNNDPRIAERTHRRLLGTRIPLRVANRHDSTEMFPL